MTLYCVTDMPIRHGASVKKMSEPTCHRPHYAKLASHNPCVVLWRGFLNFGKASIISFSMMIIATQHAAIAQQNSDDAPISGIDAIPTDIPVHASTVRDPKQPVSLLPGTIPISDSAEFLEEAPSLAAQYHQTISGTAPRAIKQAPKKPKVSSAPQKTPAVKRLAPVQTVTVAATPSPSVENASLGRATGQYQIQLGAFHDTISAQTYWASFRIRYPDLAQSHPREIATADLGSKGIFHRLRLGGFPNQITADEKCRQLIADGTDCFAIRP